MLASAPTSHLQMRETDNMENVEISICKATDRLGGGFKARRSFKISTEQVQDSGDLADSNSFEKIWGFIALCCDCQKPHILPGSLSECGGSRADEVIVTL